MIECRAHRGVLDANGRPFGFDDLPVRISGEYVREVRRGKAGPWSFRPRGCPYDLEKLVTWDVYCLEAVEMALGELPEWELGWRPAVAA